LRCHRFHPARRFAPFFAAIDTPRPLQRSRVAAKPSEVAGSGTIKAQNKN
jgi:hypothetical protein